MKPPFSHIENLSEAQDDAGQASGGRTVKAGAWVVTGKLFARLFDLVLLLILSQLLLPEDFGLIALAMAPIYIGEAILELPLVQALLRHDNPKKSMYDTAFTLGVLRGLVLAVLFTAIAWPLAKFYNDPRLVPLVCALAIAPILRGTLSPRMVTFMKRMDFRREFILDIGGKAASFIVAVSIAFATRSYWAIAAATIVTPLAMNILSYIMAPYRPKFGLSDWKTFSDMIGWNSAAQFITATNWQMDRLLLGRFVPTNVLGQYSLANELVSIPHRSLVAPLASPLMANFTLQKTKAELAQSYLLSVGSIFAMMAPILLTMSLLAEPIVTLVLSEKWLEAGSIIQGVAAFWIIGLPAAALMPLALSMDQTRYQTLRVSLEFVVKLPAMFIGVKYFGVWGAIVALGLGNLTSSTAAIFIVRKLIGVRVRTQLAVFFRNGLSLAVMGIAIWLTRPDVSGGGDIDKIGLALHLVFCGAVSCLAYGSSAYCVWRLFGKPEGVETATADFVLKARQRFRG